MPVTRHIPNRGRRAAAVVHGASILLDASLCVLSLTCALAAPPPGYYLVWGDEFNGPSLDTTKWEYWLVGNHRDAVNTASAVSLNGSNLVITTYTSGGVNYTAMLATEHHFRPRYGYYEANIQWGDTNGMWSAFWLRSPILGTWLNDPMDDGAEIDICEHRYVGKYLTNYIAYQVSDNIHWNGYGANEQSSGSPNVPANPPGVANNFHTFGLLWETHNYSFRIDDSEVWNGTSTTPPFGSDAYVILSSEVDDTSTQWAGLIPTNGYPSLSASTVKFAIDYFRYYAPTNVLFWTGAASRYWTNSSNWVANWLPASVSDLTFSYLSANLDSTLAADFAAHGLIFLNTTSNISINGTNTLSLGAGGIDMVSADHNVTVTAPLNLTASQRWWLGRNNPGNLLTVNASLSGTGTLTKAGYGRLVLNGTNTFSGTLNVDTGASTNDGVILLSGSGALANAASPIYIRNSNLGASTLQLSNNVFLPQTISLAGRNTNVVGLQAILGASNAISSGVTLAGGGTYYGIQCDAGTLYLGGTISAGSTATGARTLTLRGNGNFVLSGSIQNGSASALGLLKTNSGTLTLSGVQSYTGGTTNATGTMLLNGSLAGSLVINNGVVAGVGSVAGDGILGGGQLSPGTATVNSIGTLSFGGNLTLVSGTRTYLELNAALQTNDLLRVTGSLTCGGNLYVANLQGTFNPGQTYKIFDAGRYSGTFSTLTLPSLSTNLAWDTTALGLNGTIRVVDRTTQTVSLTNLGGNQLQVNWDYGILQSATNPAGPFSDIPGSTAPYSIQATNDFEFFRLRVP